MYNLYIYEKNELLKAKNEDEKQKSRKMQLKRKFQLSRLTSNYDKRMNDFIFNLCEHPIFIKDYTINKNNSSLQLNPKTPQLKRKSFLFGGFMTDKNRISLIDKERELNKKFEEKIMKEKNRTLKMHNHSDEKHKLIQPRMRFKPRNELERIIEVMDLLGKNPNKKKTKKLLDQLKQTDIDIVKRTQGYGKLRQLYKYRPENKNNKKDSKENSENESSSEDDLDYTLEINLHRKLRNINIELKKQRELRRKRLAENKGRGTSENINSLTIIKTRNKELLELFKDDTKIHFKGASQYAMNFKKDNKLRTISAFPFSYSMNNIKNNNLNNLNELKNIKKVKFRKISEDKRPMSMNVIDENKEKIGKYFKDDTMKKLGNKYQLKKKNMDEAFKNEINNSIIDRFFSKLNQKDYNKLFNEPFFIEKSKIMFNKETKTVDDDLQSKLNYLKNIIDSNNENLRTAKKLNTGLFKNKNFKKFNEENRINIDGRKFRPDDIKNIADAIFTKCGYYNKKIV